MAKTKRKESAMNNNLPMTNQIFNLTNPSTLPLGAKLAVKRECAAVVKEMATAMMREQGRALLANAALQSVGALGVAKDRILELSPGCADECDLITRAYAFAAARRITEF
jgi:hypothetical protein